MDTAEVNWIRLRPLQSSKSATDFGPAPYRKIEVHMRTVGFIRDQSSPGNRCLVTFSHGPDACTWVPSVIDNRARVISAPLIESDLPIRTEKPQYAITGIT